MRLFTRSDCCGQRNAKVSVHILDYDTDIVTAGSFPSFNAALKMGECTPGETGTYSAGASPIIDCTNDVTGNVGMFGARDPG